MNSEETAALRESLKPKPKRTKAAKSVENQEFAIAPLQEQIQQLAAIEAATLVQNVYVPVLLQTIQSQIAQTHEAIAAKLSAQAAARFTQQFDLPSDAEIERIIDAEWGD
jgi:hypothetical protein